MSFYKVYTESGHKLPLHSEEPLRSSKAAEEMLCAGIEGFLDSYGHVTDIKPTSWIWYMSQNRSIQAAN